MLNKFSTSSKLYLLIFITATSLIGLGLYGIGDLKKMNENTRTLYEDRVLCIQQLSNIRFEYDAEILPVAQQVKNHVLSFNGAKQRILKAEGIINNNWLAYKRTFLTPEEKLLVEQTEAEKIKAFDSDAILVSVLSKQDSLALNKLLQRGALAGPAPFALKINRLMDLQVHIA
ncbi:MAG TPA: MCP four helix bundle domain-containing protein, partial [Mucilaginibacter sp.]|nr:MCP four helix bundle domain-containing protein [Mucilaginibacter sp.]